ncbi:NAD(P)/FAD-dependent oxidoreductase [Rhodococcus sp. LB1]|uniref:NAD(P)/FAD-dependent oxidoreductase n=1 Tax=Rhodococcus sp. LB1 TaxID=1807499 RepID=UPI00077A01D2|nr:FAD-dependent oxidoreductase [Rhodococcus sp. LB1]KXX58801.1 hypothetical protein AZG88_08065 [Rhodococcus sp. LB1]
MALETSRRDGRAARLPVYWLGEQLPTPSDALGGDCKADFCIVGAGLTGLWTAYYLKKSRPDAEVVVLEKEFAGFGASGRNAGWLTSEFSASYSVLAEAGGRGAVSSMHAAMNDSVDEVLAVCEREKIDADIARGGALRVARNNPQLARLRAGFAERVEWGADAGYTWLSGGEIRERVAVDGALGGTFNEFGARVHPGKLVRGLLEVIRGIGVRVHEATAVSNIENGRALTPLGVVTSPVILRCTEGYTAEFRGQPRNWAPVSSSVIVTAPVPDKLWTEINWSNAELLADGANEYAAGQRTADGRIVMGGRGALPSYRFRSRVPSTGTTSTFAKHILSEAVYEMFPALRGLPVDHAWSGVLGVPRDWSPTVSFDAATGLGWAGGYVGSGVSTTNLAGRTLAHLATNTSTPLARLPWVGHTSPKWEPEPLRWLGVRGIEKLFRIADRREDNRNGPSNFTKVANLVSER